MLSDERLAHLRAVADLPDLTGTRYRLIRRLGSGGMATVYLVEDETLGREAALKVLSEPDPSGALAARLAAEARLLARLEHPSLVPVHDVGTLPDGRVYYVMKYVRGERLDAWTARRPPRALSLRLFVKVTEAVAFAHAHGVIHRDLKPENIMVGEFGEALVMDWGVAKRIATGDETPTLRLDPGATSPAHGPAAAPPASSATAAGSIVGTPAWMAPEQARGEIDRIDARTDVHALGALLHYLLAGRPPFEGDAAGALRRVMDEPPIPLTGLDPGIPRALQAIALRAMAKDPAARYRSAGEMGADVERFLDGLPVTAYAESLWERGARVLGRTRTLIGLVLVYLLVRVVILLFAGR
jgi:eukaryotic-like serine/threonine-protein kinase